MVCWHVGDCEVAAEIAHCRLPTARLELRISDPLEKLGPVAISC